MGLTLLATMAVRESLTRCMFSSSPPRRVKEWRPTNFSEPIFNRYGYTAKDYIASVEHYIDDPLRYGRILRKAQALIVERQAVLQREYDAAQGNAAEQHRRTED